MAALICEGEDKSKLTFEFSDKWQAYKYDEPRPDNFHYKYRLQGLKAVDVIALSDKAILLMEVKYVKAQDETSSLRFSPDSDNDLLKQIRATLSEEDQKKVILTSCRPYIADEVVKKARDTVLGLLASHRQSDSKLAVYSKALLLDNKPIILILFLERILELNQPEIFKPMASNLQKYIEQKTSFLGNIKVLVVNSQTVSAALGIKLKDTNS